jgi:hypothetical protein
MDSTLKPKQTDDPHDVLEVAPGVALVVPAEKEVSNLLRAAARQHSDQQTYAGSDFPAGPAVPPVDTTFRPAAVDNVRVAGDRPSIGGRVIRGFIGFLLAICIGVAAAAWQSYGGAAQQMIARWAPQFVPISSPPQKPGLPGQAGPSAVQASAANTPSPQPAPPAQSAAQGAAPAPAAPSSGEAQSLQSMARDLATAGQEIDQLKASIEQLKANQDQMSRDIAKASQAKVSETRASEVRASEARASEVKPSEQNLRPRISALPPRSAAAPVRRPMPTFRPSPAAAAPMLPPAAAPYVPPRQVEPLPPPPDQPPLDPELASVPRPPMPVR